jgi:aromatic ring-opening dioxygenase catalytic subunit (LigB family)
MKQEMAGLYDRLEATLREMPAQIGVTPRAILMVSAHWEEREFTVMSNPRPPMLYDYSGFPAHTYHVRYDAPGSPGVAEQVAGLLRGAGINTRLDAARGFDHGAFAPLAVMYPNADVPVVQLSLKQGLDPEQHLALGRALAPLREDGILIVGSGLSYHNLRAFGPAGQAPSAAFDRWLDATVRGRNAAQRSAALVAWQHAPAARIAHPREEHLLPLMVAVGAAGDAPAQRVYHERDFAGSLTVSSYRFGGG